jgi:hypothetical protein
MTTFKTKGYELSRKSDKKTFTHAVIFRNIGGSPIIDPGPGATFHVNFKLAQTEAKRISKCDWLELLEIVEVEVAA